MKNEAASTEVIVILFTTDKNEYACLYDIDNRFKRVWRKEVGGYSELDVKAITKEIAEYLAKTMSLEQFLQDKILHEPIETILSLAERVKNNGEVKAHRGCFYLSIKGKQGKPMEIDL
jgi:hypothetical protein